MLGELWKPQSRIIWFTLTTACCAPSPAIDVHTSTKVTDALPSNRVVAPAPLATNDGLPSPPPEPSCQSSDVCKKDGRCGEVMGQCVVRSDVDCAQSAGCADDGLCALRGGSCVATAADCMRSAGCLEEGICGVKDSSCTPTAAGCKRSTGCRDGRCSVVYDGAQCGQGSRADCLKSELCKSAGHCSYDGETCAIQRDSDCLNTRFCKTGGLCGAKNGECHLTKAHHCLRSEVCTEQGACGMGAVDSATGRRMCVGTTAGCRNSADCKQWGLCGLVKYELKSSSLGYMLGCAPTKTAHCKASTDCKNKGVCTFTPGQGCTL